MSGSSTPSPVRLFRTLLAVRYRLLWARVRSRRGAIALVVLGYFVAAIVAAAAALGGMGLAAAAAPTGRSRLIAEIAFTALWLNVSIAGVLLGAGTQRLFSEASLRRYPLSGASRRAVRHLTALFEPIWIIALAAAVGLGAGFGWWDVGRSWLVPVVALLFVSTTYAGSVLLVEAGQWLLAKRGGPIIVTVAGVMLMTGAPMAPALLARGGLEPAVRALLAMAPPFAAARAATAPDLPAAATNLLILLAWTAGLLAASGIVERLPRRAAATPRAASWLERVYERTGRLFGAAAAPLATKMLRYFTRSPQLRYNYPLALPLVALMLSANSASASAAELFVFALGAAPAVPFLATGTLTANLFGFEGAGVRRYFLVPMAASQVFRTAALVSLVPGAVLIVVAIAAWVALAPADTTLRMTAMLVAAMVAGWLSFHALGLWTTLLAPRPIPFNATFGNKLSPAANALFIAVMVTFFFLPLGFSALGADLLLRWWWVAFAALGAAVVMVTMTVRSGGAIFAARRERLVAQMEGH